MLIFLMFLNEKKSIYKDKLAKYKGNYTKNFSTMWYVLMI